MPNLRDVGPKAREAEGAEKEPARVGPGSARSERKAAATRRAGALAARRLTRAGEGPIGSMVAPLLARGAFVGDADFAVCRDRCRDRPRCASGDSTGQTATPRENRTLRKEANATVAAIAAFSAPGSSRRFPTRQSLRWRTVSRCGETLHFPSRTTTRIQDNPMPLCGYQCIGLHLAEKGRHREVNKNRSDLHLQET